MRLISTLALGAAVSLSAAMVPQAGTAGELRVVTDIAPVYSLVARVMDGVSEPVLLMDQGADAHHFALRPSQARSLQNADLVVWIGPEMTPWLQSALTGIADGKAQLGLLAYEGTSRLAYGAHPAHDHGEGSHDHGNHEGHDHAGHGSEGAHDGHDHGDHDHSHGDDDHAHKDHDHADHHHDEAAAHADHDHDHGHSHDGTDPHAWLDPANGIAWVEVIAKELAARDPSNAETYLANAKAAQAELAALDATIAAELAPLAEMPFVVAHDALGYFTSHFGLRQGVAVADGDARVPGAARLRALREQMRDQGIVCAFPEVGRDASLLELVVEDSPVRLGVALDPEGRDIAIGKDLYAEILRSLAQGLSGCLKG